MYPWVDETRNPLGGACKHNCKYCYMKKSPFNKSEKYKGEPFIDERELERIKGSGKTIFICSATDLFGDWVPRQIIEKILERCREYPENRYLFQTKNPHRFGEFVFPTNTILGTTLETNRNYQITSAPPTEERYIEFKYATRENAFPLHKNIERMVSIEPIMDFDLVDLKSWIWRLKPSFVSIGADSKNNNLPEPSWEKVQRLISELEKFTEVKLKKNLNRLRKDG